MAIVAGGTAIGACCWPVDRSRVAPPIRMAEAMPKIAANTTFRGKGSNLRRLIGNYLRCLQSWHPLEHRSQPRRFTTGVLHTASGFEGSKVRNLNLPNAKSNGRLRLPRPIAGILAPVLRVRRGISTGSMASALGWKASERFGIDGASGRVGVMDNCNGEIVIGCHPQLMEKLPVYSAKLVSLDRWGKC